MIEMIKNSTRSFLLKTDVQGVEEMLKYIKIVSEKGGEYITILYSGKETRFVIKLDSDSDEMLMEEDIIVVIMEEEELEYLEERLNNSLISKCFYPAEICERRYKGKYTTIYCNVIS